MRARVSVAPSFARVDSSKPKSRGDYGPDARASGRFFVRRRLRVDNKCDNTYSRGVTSTLQAELKQHKPLKSLEVEAHLSIQRTAALLEHAFESAL